MPSVCFVVQPIGQRSDNVFDWYLTKALENKFTLVQPGSEPTSSITADIFKHLRDDDLVVAFLGSPYRIPTLGNSWLWNPNVMLEAGFRMGLRRPILFVREKRAQDDEPLLPFDLFDISVIELVSADEEKLRVNREKIIHRIREHADAIVKPQPEEPDCTIVYTFPAVTMAFGGGAGKITVASDDVAAFLRYPSGKNLVGLDAGEFVKQLTAEMVPSQRDAFNAEQERLFGVIFIGKKPSATVCIVFGKDPIQPGAKLDNAYLPIVTRFRATRGEPTILEVIYLNVTASAVAGHDGVVRCNLHMATPEYSLAKVG
jgi:hypothetical protein